MKKKLLILMFVLSFSLLTACGDDDSKSQIQESTITQNEFENGYYEQATKIINIAKSVTFSGLNSVFGSRISWLFSQKKYDEVKIMINNSINYILFNKNSYFI